MSMISGAADLAADADVKKADPPPETVYNPGLPYCIVLIYPEADATTDGTTVCIMNTNDFVFVEASRSRY